ncbi:MAG: ABC transporter substrate-binding protein [Nocardioidaceae bacterium]
MRRPHWIMATVAVTGAGLLAACSGGPAASSGGSSKTLQIAAVSTDRAGMQAVIKKFEKKNSGVQVNVSYADTDEYQRTLRTQLSAGTAPDVFFVWPGNGNSGAMEVLAPHGFIADLSDQPWVSNIPKGIRPVTQTKGKTYILPTTFTGIGTLYNKKALAEVGKQPPKTWSQLLALCDAAKADGKVAFALGNQTSWVTQLVDYALVPTLVWAKNPGFADDMQAGKASFEKSGWKTAMQRYLEMDKRGCFSKDPLGTSVNQSVSQVASGKAVAIIQVTSTLNQLKSQAPKDTEFGLFPVPATNDPSETMMPGAAGGSYGVNAHSENKKLAIKFIDFLATPKMIDLYASTVGSLPAIPNDQYKVDPVLKPLLEYQKAGKTVPFMDQLWPNPKVQQAHFTGVQDMFSGQATPSEVLTKMDQAYREGR